MEKKSKDIGELHQKLNENYRLVAELSSDNLRLSTEKAAAEQLLDEVKHEQSLLRTELGKAQKVIEDSMAGSYHEQQHWNTRQHLHRQSSPETSASSFDFFPTTTASAAISSLGVNNKNQRRRGSMPPPPRGRSQKSNRKWKGGASSDYVTETPPRKRSSSTKSFNPAGSDVSSPDLGVDLGSDTFSSLERANIGQPGTYSSFSGNYICTY